MQAIKIQFSWHGCIAKPLASSITQRRILNSVCACKAVCFYLFWASWRLRTLAMTFPAFVMSQLLCHVTFTCGPCKASYQAVRGQQAVGNCLQASLTIGLLLLA